ncbi:MAG TPA: type III secretion system cytoplasmic ring protein SctQ [Trinickia sp.]|jgi:type III secretion protein Q|nr:type III secretion system cytoplasmic ring protein SctQ [Trinickia sp.]
MHRLPRLDARAARLLRKVGVGRRIEFDGGALSLVYRRAGGNGLIFSGGLEHRPVQLWIDEREWLHWIEPVLAVADANSIPEDLHEALAAWTFDAIGRGLGGSAQSGSTASAASTSSTQWPAGSSLRTAHIEPRLGWCLRAEQGERGVDVLVLDAPHDWLDTLADRLPPWRRDNAPEVRIRAGLLAGWASVTRSVMATLRVGDALLLRRAYRVAQGEFGLFMAKPIARLRCGETGDTRDAGIFTIEEVMDKFDDWLDVEPPAPALDDQASYDPLVTVVAEVCGFDVPVSALAALKPGDVLTGDVLADELVALKVGGRLIARATLLDIDGRLAARIETL